MKKMINKNFRKAERGNVLFLILIAVALFAALSYAVTQSSRTGGGASDGESNLINSAQVTQYPASVRTAIVRMIIRGIAENQLEFNPPVDFDDLTETRFGVFHPQGGGATHVTAPPEVMAGAGQGTWIFSSAYQIQNIGTTDAASNSANDIIAFLPNISLPVCQRINRELGIPGPLGNRGVPVAVATAIPSAADSMDTDNPGIAVVAPAANTIAGSFSGQPFGCADFDDDLTNGTGLVYYHVLVER
ncbi:MAG: hypothetical protein ACK4VI_00645 [Alphaproteobacteria bacterium]